MQLLQTAVVDCREVRGMTKFLSCALPMALAALTLLGGCFDPSPGEIGLQTTVKGVPRACNVQVFNSKGKQIQQEHADQYGVAFVQKLVPDTYTLKFQGPDGKMYAAVRTLKVQAGSSPHLDVDLDVASDAKGEAEANSGGAAQGGNGTDTTDLRPSHAAGT